jgi:competence protein ComEC
LNAAWWLTFSAVLGIVLFIQKVPFLKPVSIDTLSIKTAPTKAAPTRKGDIEDQEQEKSLNVDPVLKAKLLILFISLKSKMVYLVKFQVFITIWMMPVVLFWFGGVSVSGVVTNLIAIPIFSLILVPCIFIGTIGALLDITWLTYLLVFADVLLSPLINLFSSYSIFHYWVDLAFGVWAWWLLIICCVLVLPAYGFSRQFSSKAASHRISRRKKGSLVLGLLLFLPMALSFYPWQTSSLKQFQPKLKMFVLDVGQGTSILFQQGSSAFIYDLGPIYPSGFNATQAVVQPMLVGLGITDVAHIVISHNDSDHIGDINVLGKPEWIAARKRNCKPQMFNWLNVKVEMIWPEEPQFNSFTVKKISGNKLSEKRNKLSKNDSSCVVKITDKLTNKTVLLTGDITSKIERRLLVMHNKSKIDLTSDVLISAHHGSKYSSAQKFINTVAPIKVLHSAGVNNRFGFPTKEVIRRFDIFADQAVTSQQIQPQQTEPHLMQTKLPLITQYSTNKQGMLEVTFTQTGGDPTGKNLTDDKLIVEGYLNNWQPFWKKQNPFRFTSKIR